MARWGLRAVLLLFLHLPPLGAARNNPGILAGGYFARRDASLPCSAADPGRGCGGVDFVRTDTNPVGRHGFHALPGFDVRHHSQHQYHPASHVRHKDSSQSAIRV
jgi:hypothetical protein